MNSPFVEGGLRKMGINRVNIFVIMFICLIGLPLVAENDAKAITFVNKVKGAGRVSTAVQTTNGGYVSISRTKSGPCVVRKISDSGQRIWERRLSFQKGDDGFVFINGIAQTKDGYILVGWGPDYYYSNALAFIVKLKTDGTVRWSKTFAPSYQTEEIFFRSVSATADGGYIVQGDFSEYPQTGTILVKFTSSGDVLWSKSFKDLSYSLSQPVSDGLILAHQLEPFDRESSSLRVLKVNDSGSIVWKKTLDIENFQLQTLGRASDAGVVLAGKSLNSNELILIGLNANGKLHLRASYALEVPDFFVSGLIQTSDGGYVITGTKFNPKTAGNRGGIVLRIDTKRNLVFQKTFGLSDTEEDAESVFATAEGGFTVFGSSGLNDMLVLNLNSDGVVPGCTFLDELSAKKVASPSVTSENLEIVSQDFSLPTLGYIGIFSYESEKASLNACP